MRSVLAQCGQCLGRLIQALLGLWQLADKNLVLALQRYYSQGFL